MVHEHRCINVYQTLFGGLTTIKSLFSRETKKTKVPNLFDLYHMLMNDKIMH